jgi:hypothetical protein
LVPRQGAWRQTMGLEAIRIRDKHPLDWTCEVEGPMRQNSMPWLLLPR